MKKAGVMKRYAKLRGCAVLAAFAIVGVAGVAEADFLIILRNGKEFKVRQYEEVGDQIVFKRYGGKVSISKARVATIKEVKASGEVNPTAAKRLRQITTFYEEHDQLKHWFGRVSFSAFLLSGVGIIGWFLATVQLRWCLVFLLIGAVYFLLGVIGYQGPLDFYLWALVAFPCNVVLLPLLLAVLGRIPDSLLNLVFVMLPGINVAFVLILPTVRVESHL